MIILLLIVIVINVKALTNPHGPTVVSEFTKCASELIEFNFKRPGLLIFANTGDASTSVSRIRTELLKNINGYAKYSVQVKSPVNEPPICEENNADDEALAIIHMDQYEAIPLADYFIVIIDSYKDFTHVASRLIRSRIWNPHAKFIVLLFSIETNDKENITLVENILSCLFKHNVINVVVIVPQQNNIRNAIIYSWKPFDPPQYCGYYNETANNRLLVENTCIHGIAKTTKDIFLDRIPDEMEGCVLEILALERQPFISGDVEDPNIERVLIRELSERYKFKTRYQIINSFRGERNDAGNWDGALEKLVAKKGHILLGGIFPDFDVHEDFECSSSYLADSYTWVAPRAFPRAQWVALIIIFQEIVWYSAIAGFFICVLSWRFLGQLSRETLYHRTLSHCSLNVWIASLGFCTYVRPVTHSLRLFYVFLNLYCILFLTAYQTKLIDVLTNPTFEEQINTVEELVTSDLKYGGFEELHDLFYNSSDSFDYIIGEKWIDVDNITKALIDVAVHRNFSVLCSRLELAHLSATIPELSDNSGNDRLYAFDTDTFTVPMEMIALRGFAFIAEFSKTLEIFKQLGVNAGVRRYFTSFNSRRRAKLMRSIYNKQSDVEPLSLQRLQGGFLALLLGFGGGTLVLITEIIVNTKYVKDKMVELKSFVKGNRQ